jgi:hypothetical protein
MGWFTKSNIQKIKEAFSKRGTGRYGMIEEQGKVKDSYSTRTYYIEFMELGKTTNERGETMYSIKVTNVSCSTPGSEKQSVVRDFYKLEWIKHNEHKLYWFDNNAANIREKAINELLGNNENT